MNLQPAMSLNSWKPTQQSYRNAWRRFNKWNTSYRRHWSRARPERAMQKARHSFATAAAEAQIQATMTEIEKVKNDLSDVQIIKNSLGLKENG